MNKQLEKPAQGATTSSIYADNTEYLNDLLAFVDLLRSKVLDKKDGASSEKNELEREYLMTIFSGIRTVGRAALRRGVGLGLEKIVRKNKLDDVEAQILVILAFASVHADDDLNKVGDIGKMIQFLNKLDPVTAMPYWRKDSRLIVKKLITPSYPYRERGRPAVPNALFLEASTLDLIAGKKTPREKGPVIRCLPSTLYEKLGEYVVGQKNARRMVATGVYKHQQICRLNRKRKGVDRLQKANLLLIGATGTGKTHLCRTLAQILKVPFVICDATQYTETGYVGANVEEMLVALSEKGGGKSGTSRGGIIFIDEIDKIAHRNVGPSHRSTRDVSGLSVQNELLKLLDGEVVQFQNAEYDVSNILFIAGGAFAGLEGIITARLKQKQIGFAANGEVGAYAETSSLSAATTEDLITYGLTPEFIGRFASLVALDPLGKSELVDILTKPRNSLLSQYQTLFKASGINLQVPQTAVEWVAAQAMENNTGARGLKSILEAHLSPILFEQGSAVCGQRGQAPLKEVAFDPEAEMQLPRIMQA